MNIDEYQKWIESKAPSKAPESLENRDLMLSWYALGLTGEAGEVADLVKKGIYHEQGLSIEKITKELGDVLWYVTAMASTLNLQMSDVIQTNVTKLEARFPKGYEASRTTFKEGDAS